MEQLYLCAYCGEENEIEIDAGDGDHQKLVGACGDCGQTNVITAQYNFHSNEFDLSVTREETE
jgi:DNA-directed RNA polymerase subunit RPC12/RpoP